MFNMEQYNIDNIEESEDGNLNFILNGTIFSHGEFRESFIPSFCVTVYKYQGGTISTPNNMYDVEKIDKKQLYTALSRTTELNHVHLYTTKLNRKYKIRMPPHFVTVNSLMMITTMVKFTRLRSNTTINCILVALSEIYKSGSMNM